MICVYNVYIECFVLLFFQAFRVSLGKLGIITAIKMKIVQEQPVSRTQSRGILPSQFIGMLRDAQEMYKTTRSLPQWMNETQVFWIVQNHEVMLRFCVSLFLALLFMLFHQHMRNSILLLLLLSSHYIGVAFSNA